jgi:hypothetical protein
MELQYFNTDWNAAIYGYYVLILSKLPDISFVFSLHRCDITTNWQILPYLD